MVKSHQTYTIGSVTSKDGTTIGYRQLGSGPGIILLHGAASASLLHGAASASLLHGAASASQHFMKLGVALSDAFTVYIPDRRGRGLSGPFGDNYGTNFTGVGDPQPHH
jgi:pimeloyl-ACP methyl ester carboxylesterase